MSKHTRREYWRQVRNRAWVRSKDHFAFLWPIIGAVVVSLLAWYFQGRQAAVNDYLKPEALGVLALVVIALPMYVVNLFRGAADLHEEQMTAIGDIELKGNERAAGLERRIAELTRLPDSLRIHFESEVPPFKETQGVLIGIALGGLPAPERLPLDRTTTIFRVRVDNTSITDLNGVAVRLSFEPERARMSNLSLHLMHDNPDNPQAFRRSFGLAALDHQFVDVVLRHAHEPPGAHLCHIVQGVDDRLPVGTYHVVITAVAGGVRPTTERFTIDVQHASLSLAKREA